MLVLWTGLFPYILSSTGLSCIFSSQISNGWKIGSCQDWEVAEETTEKQVISKDEKILLPPPELQNQREGNSAMLKTGLGMTRNSEGTRQMPLCCRVHQLEIVHHKQDRMVSQPATFSASAADPSSSYHPAKMKWGLPGPAIHAPLRLFRSWSTWNRKLQISGVQIEVVSYLESD